MEEELTTANKRLKTAFDELCRCYEAEISQLDKEESIVSERLSKLKEKKAKTAQEYGNIHAAGGDLVEVNAGGEIISAKRSTLIQLEGTRLEALFSGRWDKKLQRDSHGRIFLDVNPVCFRAIVDHLSEMAISSEENPPSPPSVDEEYKLILGHQLNLFGICIENNVPDSTIIQEAKEANQLHDWLQEDGSDGDFNLLYRGSRDGMGGGNFHSKCDNQGCTLTIIETTNGYVIGGYSNVPWASDGTTGRYRTGEKSFLFVLSGSDISSPTKMKLKSGKNTKAVYHLSKYGPTFGGGHDLNVNGVTVNCNVGHTYTENITGQLVANNGIKYNTFTIKEMEVFGVTCKPSNETTISSNQTENQHTAPKAKSETRFSESVNTAINRRRETLVRADSEIVRLEDSFNDEQAFVSAFASGDAKDVVSLNVSGAVMTTKRSTLCTASDSVLAQQFDDTKWTEQGSKVEEWTPDDVKEWAESINGMKENVGETLKENEITGCELLALEKDGLMMLGITRTGTLCLLLKEIKKLQNASQDAATLIEHSPYCFGKILDYLRLKQLHSQGLTEEPALPTVCDSHKKRFEKVVKYYFPGDSSKFILG